MEILGDYHGYMTRVEELLDDLDFNKDELAQCDTLGFEVNTNARYEIVKQQLALAAKLLDEREVNGRQVSIFCADPLLKTENWNIPYIELLQPKLNREYVEGIDCAFFVTALPLPHFLQKHPDISFDKKGLANKLNAYVEYVGDDVSIKLHDKHFGAVIGLEQRLREED
jgi:predicted metalloenzyme YecM